MVSEFETLLLLNLKSLERFVNYKVNNREDAQDIIQEACLIASQKFDTLRDKTLFKAWLIRIANNKCIDYYRRKSKIETNKTVIKLIGIIKLKLLPIVIVLF